MNAWYGDTYMDANPKTWALQQLGLGMTNAIVDHILRSDSRVRDPAAKSYYKSRRRKFSRTRVVPVPLVGGGDNATTILNQPPPIALTHPLAMSRRPAPQSSQNATSTSVTPDVLAGAREDPLLQFLGLST